MTGPQRTQSNERVQAKLLLWVTLVSFWEEMGKNLDKNNREENIRYSLYVPLCLKS
jgi:hypothetical protein